MVVSPLKVGMWFPVLEMSPSFNHVVAIVFYSEMLFNKNGFLVPYLWLFDRQARDIRTMFHGLSSDVPRPYYVCGTFGGSSVLARTLLNISFYFMLSHLDFWGCQGRQFTALPMNELNCFEWVAQQLYSENFSRPGKVCS